MSLGSPTGGVLTGFGSMLTPDGRLTFPNTKKTQYTYFLEMSISTRFSKASLVPSSLTLAGLRFPQVFIKGAGARLGVGMLMGGGGSFH